MFLGIHGDYCGFRTDGIEIRNGVIYRDDSARTGLAFYLDGSVKVYDETAASADQLLADGVWNTLSFGPAILVDGVIPDNIDNVEVDTNVGNHSIQGNQPRTDIGVIDNNHFIFVVVDGGGSSTMYFRGCVINNPLGKGQERGVSDILYVG